MNLLGVIFGLSINIRFYNPIASFVLFDWPHLTVSKFEKAKDTEERGRFCVSGFSFHNGIRSNRIVRVGVWSGKVRILFNL